MAEISARRVSRYLNHLPALFQQDVDQYGVNFLGRFLLAFEAILSGLGAADDPEIQEGIEEVLDRIHTYFDPRPKTEQAPNPSARSRAPEEFLPWLASWVALTLREDWTPEEKRRFIAQIVPLYRLRGTQAGLEKMLRLYTSTTAENGVRIQDFEQVPHYFQVELRLPTPDPQKFRIQEQIARAIIDQEKPAHTFYALKVRTATTIQIGRRSTIGVNTLLGSRLSLSNE